MRLGGKEENLSDKGKNNEPKTKGEEEEESKHHTLTQWVVQGM